MKRLRGLCASWVWKCWDSPSEAEGLELQPEVWFVAWLAQEELCVGLEQEFEWVWNPPSPV